jgi:hypothetical protein
VAVGQGCVGGGDVGVVLALPRDSLNIAEFVVNSDTSPRMAVQGCIGTLVAIDTATGDGASALRGVVLECVLRACCRVLAACLLSIMLRHGRQSHDSQQIAPRPRGASAPRLPDRMPFGPSDRNSRNV